MNPAALRRALLIGLTVLIVLAPLVAGAWYVASKHVWAQARLAELEPRYARLLGIRQQNQELQAAYQKAMQAKNTYVYPAVKDDTQTGNQAQQKARELFTAAGLQIVSSQVMPAKDDRGFDRIALVVRAEGELLALQSALAVLGQQQPAMVLSELNVQVHGGLVSLNPKSAPRLTVVFTLSVLRERP